uniref:ERCC4 domain-containing protein n=1 Tax=viral metagenome TaxID=1070528 RepID=A0A6C0D459_9ZZZZ
MRIVVDERETSLYEKIEHLVNTEGNAIGTIQLSKKVIPLGDILIQTDEETTVAIIERKSLQDLLSSIKDGRYEEQSYRLSYSSGLPQHNILYVIEGMFSQLRTLLEKKTVYSCMTSLNMFKGFSVHRTCTIQETAETVLWMACKMERDLQKGKMFFYQPSGGEHPPQQNQPITPYCSVVKKVKKENVTPENIAEIILCQIPGISSNTAVAIMKQFHTFSNLIDAVRNNPQSLDTVVCESKGKVRKISKTCAQNIVAYLGADPLPQTPSQVTDA